MFKISIENVQALVTQAYLAHAEAAFGSKGATGIKELLNEVKLIYQHCPPERLLGTLTVVFGMQATPQSPTIAQLGSARSCADHVDIGRFLVSIPSGSHAVVEIVADKSFRLVSCESEIDLTALAQTSLIYRFDGTADRILAKQFDDFVPSVSPLLKSNFSVPTLNGLEEALRYYSTFVADSKCRLLKDVWQGGVDGPRLVLVNKPEQIMRDSLAQALELVLRDVTVKPEQNTDETKPVDIRVNWFASGAVALIEIKWLGKSIAKSQVPKHDPTYTEYTASRAQDGADQLADYLEREVRHSTAIALRGYLVVFDARRKGTKGEADRLAEPNAMAFANDQLTFAPDHSKSRKDFAAPVRFFMNPRRSHFLAA